MFLFACRAFWDDFKLEFSFDVYTVNIDCDLGYSNVCSLTKHLFKLS